MIIIIFLKTLSKAYEDRSLLNVIILIPDILAETKSGRGGEVQLTDAIDTLNKTQRMYSRESGMMLVTKKAISKPQLSTV